MNGGDDTDYRYSTSIKVDSLQELINLLFPPEDIMLSPLFDLDKSDTNNSGGEVMNNFKRSCSVNISLEKEIDDNIFEDTTTTEEEGTSEISSALLSESLSDILFNIDSSPFSTNDQFYIVNVYDVMLSTTPQSTSEKQENMNVYDLTFSLNGSVSPTNSVKDSKLQTTDSILEQEIMNGHLESILEQKSPSSVKSVHTNSFKCT